jgi:hypothetical protein
MGQKPFIYQKLEALFRKHSHDGTTPRKLIEAGISREFRLCRDDVRRMMDEMELEKDKFVEKKKAAATIKAMKYDRVNKKDDDYLAELRSFR